MLFVSHFSKCFQQCLDPEKYMILFSVRVHFIWPPVAMTEHDWTWLNMTWIKLQQWWLFNSINNNSHEHMLLYDVIKCYIICCHCFNWETCSDRITYRVFNLFICTMVLWFFFFFLSLTAEHKMFHIQQKVCSQDTYTSTYITNM